MRETLQGANRACSVIDDQHHTVFSPCYHPGFVRGVTVCPRRIFLNDGYTYSSAHCTRQNDRRPGFVFRTFSSARGMPGTISPLPMGTPTARTVIVMHRTITMVTRAAAASRPVRTSRRMAATAVGMAKSCFRFDSTDNGSNHAVLSAGNSRITGSPGMVSKSIPCAPI